MPKLEPLPPESVYARCDPASLPFETTAEVSQPRAIVGQERALEAIRFATSTRREGYNLFLMGPTGLGKHTVIREFLADRAASEPTPPDWCYVHNFVPPHKPRCVKLPAGRGSQLAQDLEELVADLRTGIPAAFESDEYRNRVQQIRDEFSERPEEAFRQLAEEAEQQGMTLIKTPDGFALGPVRDGEVLDKEEFDKLPPDEQKRIHEKTAELEKKLEHIMALLPGWAKEGRQKVEQLDQEITKLAVKPLVDALKKKYADIPEIAAHLDAIEQDIIEVPQRFKPQEENPLEALGGELSPFNRYRANLIVDHSQQQGAPVVYEDHPVYHNLVGRIEHLSRLGALITDFTLIKPGALHAANGGYLILDVRRLLLQPYAWEGLKLALRGGKIKIESLAELYSLGSTVSLEPEPIPLDAKVVLVGDRELYYLLYQVDPDFRQLFKVLADFDDQLDRDDESVSGYARLIAALAAEHDLRPFGRDAVARVIEQSSRVVSDVEKLSTHISKLTDLLTEADHWAEEQHAEHVGAKHVQQAIDAQIRRADRVSQRVQEMIGREMILIDTAGSRVGQVNGLSVLDLGNFSFGRPSRITATARLGKGEVVDIEREVELGGAIHSKGVLILSSFLASRYARNEPLSLQASLVFEQSYGMVDGDSASVAELCALLSVLSGKPIRQNLAVTGSVNQHGVVQPVGGVNEKIEGFFDVCQARGLTGEQGVLLPKANVKNLMLRRDVVEAVAEGRFRVFAMETIDQAVELLMDTPAGEPDEQGEYPAGTVNALVRARLQELSEIQISLATEKIDKLSNE